VATEAGKLILSIPAPQRARLAPNANGPAFGMSAVVYDAAVLVAADRNERQAWAEHNARLEFGVFPLVPSPVVAQVSRSHNKPKSGAS
jgi:hypothetical protein